jgi:hypothetical protein
MAKRKKSNPKITWEQIGTVCVDTGCITIGDQCRLVDLDEDEYLGNAVFKQIEQPAHGRPGDKIIPTAVSLRTGIGDGEFAVMADFSDGLIKAIRIEFLGEEFYQATEKHIPAQQKNAAQVGGHDYRSEALANTVAAFTDVPRPIVVKRVIVNCDGGESLKKAMEDTVAAFRDGSMKG